MQLEKKIELNRLHLVLVCFTLTEQDKFPVKERVKCRARDGSELRSYS
jgi:hypothetical protein